MCYSFIMQKVYLSQIDEVYLKACTLHFEVHLKY